MHCKQCEKIFHVELTFIYCPWKKLTKMNKDFIELKTNTYLENLQYSIEYAPAVLYNDYDDHETQFVLKHVQIEYFKSLPPLLHCKIQITNTIKSKEWFKKNLKDVFDEFFRGFTFDGSTNEVCESISI
jgi:Ran GTPase-activating protein (RanGAP) involved in mRNA processing and transport